MTRYHLKATTRSLFERLYFEKFLFYGFLLPSLFVIAPAMVLYTMLLMKRFDTMSEPQLVAGFVHVSVMGLMSICFPG